LTISVDEEFRLFSLFVEWMYCVHNNEGLIIKPENMELWIECYAMAERIVADGFKTFIFTKFLIGAERYHGQVLEDLAVKLLRVACEQIPPRKPKDDSMRILIFWLVAKQLGKLKEQPEFKTLMEENSQAAVSLLMRAGNSHKSDKWDPDIA
jgi:hypothetical protein